MFFFVFSDEDIWPLARQQVQEQVPVEQVVSMLVLVETCHPSPEQALVEPVIPEPAQVEMYIPVESQEELQAPASLSMVRMVRWHTVCNWVSGSLTYSYWGICSYFAFSYWDVCREISYRMKRDGTKL